MVLSTWAIHLSSHSEGTANDLIDECVRILAQTGNIDDSAMRKRFMAPPSGDDHCSAPLDGLDEVVDVAKRKKCSRPESFLQVIR